MMQFIDTHTHLFAEQFELDQKEVIQRALNSGITKMCIPHIDQESTKQFYNLCNAYPNNCFPLMGLHPTSVTKEYKTQLDFIFKQFEDGELNLDQGKFYGVGEIGIDLFWDKTSLKYQQEAFEQQLLFAKEKKMPIIIHARESFNELFEIVDKHLDDNLFGIFHCFTGNIEQAQHIMKYETFLMGIGGVLTFKNSGLDKTLEKVPLDFLVLETDSPYLAPIPHRGKRNETSYLTLVAEKMASVYQCSLEHIADVTTRNAKSIFNFGEE